MFIDSTKKGAFTKKEGTKWDTIHLFQNQVMKITVYHLKYVYLSKQFRDYFASKKPVDLIVREHTKISKPLERAIKQSGGKITRY